jgi:hypothetical protein
LKQFKIRASDINKAKMATYQQTIYQVFFTHRDIAKYTYYYEASLTNKEERVNKIDLAINLSIEEKSSGLVLKLQSKKNNYIKKMDNKLMKLKAILTQLQSKVRQGGKS